MMFDMLFGSPETTSSRHDGMSILRIGFSSHNKQTFVSLNTNNWNHENCRLM